MRYIAYKTSSDGDFKTLKVPSNFLAAEIDRTLVAKEGALHNWFGASNAQTAADAIQEAIAGGYTYRSPQEMTDLKGEAFEFSRASDVASRRGQKPHR